MFDSALSNSDFAVAALSDLSSPFGLEFNVNHPGLELPDGCTGNSLLLNNGVMVMDLEKWRKE